MPSAILIGGTGYTGVELLRLLCVHPQVEIAAVTSRGDAGTPVSALHPGLRGSLDLDFVEPDAAALPAADVAFFATPNATAMHMAARLLERGIRVIDLAADFRLRSAAEWQRWYGEPHACPELLAEAVYGLPEINRAAITGARLVANPGCYPTAVALALLPFAEAGLLDGKQVIADAKSGATGAGRRLDEGNLFASVAENFRAYGVAGHRHLPEIRQTLGAAERGISLTFVPHLLPMLRGILATVYLPLAAGVDPQGLFEQRYGSERFVDVMPAGSLPETAAVRASNYCRIAVHRPREAETVVALAVIDNLVKGAAGQAVQNMNIMFGLDEACGLGAAALMP